MPSQSIITIGTSGVEMRSNPLFLGVQRSAFARNLAFDESTIKVRPSIKYHSLGLNGVFQGSTYFTPRFGLSATSYSKASTSLATVVSGKVYLNPIGENGVEKPIELRGTNFKGDTYLWTAEHFLIVVNKNSSTYWWSTGVDMVESQGLGDCDTEVNSHDVLDNCNIVHWLPNCATIGHYIHARNHVSVDFGSEYTCGEPLNSEILVSDILGKRGCFEADDHLKMEEQMLDSMGGSLVTPSRYGKTVAFATLPSEDKNGEGLLFDFRECGVYTHNTEQTPRESIYNPENATLQQQGWDTIRLSNSRLNTVSAVARYAVTELPSDIFFRSEYGFHFLKKTLGTGTIKDQTLNHESHDVQPLFDLDDPCDGADLSGASTGHWLRGNRFLGSVGFRTMPFHSSSSVGRGMVVMNQATTFSEDDTPRLQWEGLWTFDKDFAGIHRFTQGGQKPRDKSYGFIGSDNKRNLYYSELQKTSTGKDYRDGEDYVIEWEYVSGAFAFGGLKAVDRIRSAVLDVVTDSSTESVEIYVRTDEHQRWELWYELRNCFKEGDSANLISQSFGEPPRDVREATWFQFMIKGKGYIEIRTFDIEYARVIIKDDGRNHCVPVCLKQEEFFNEH